MGFLDRGQPASPARDVIAARNGARWFYWIAGLSVLNSAVAVGGSSFMMLFGLTSTLLATYLGMNLGGAALGIGVAIAVLVSLGFAGLGWMAERGALWAFATGLAIYALDAGLTIYFKDWFAAAAHVFALVTITAGMLASRRVHAVAAYPAQGTAGEPAPASSISHAVPGPVSLTPPAPLGGVPAGFAEATAPAPLD